ncbi:MAG TPA: hypothetical protein VLJ12_10125 [Burkholderiales bacterium]|nr:hypothetical protein [Burkholderiales bacterium]
MFKTVLLLTASALLAFPLALRAQAENVGKTAESADRLIQKYTPLAGSEDNAKSLVTGLRDGAAVKLSSGGTSTSFTPPTGKMGFGNVNIALSLAEASLKQQGITNPTSAQLQGALVGVLQQRADGKGWGQIANSMGFKLGEVVRPERPEKPVRPDKPERPDRPEKPERPGR